VAVLLGCLAGACFGAVNVAVRIGLRRLPDADVGGLVTGLHAFALVLVVALAVDGPGAFRLGEIWPFLVTGVVVPGVSQILWIKAIRDAGASRAAIVMGTSPLLGALLALVVLEEPFRVPLVIGTVLIVAGGMAIAWEPRRPAGFKAVGIALAVGCAVLLAGRDNVARAVLVDRDVPPLVAGAALVGGACAFLIPYTLALRWRDLRPPTLAAAFWPFLPAGLLMGLVYVTLLNALDRGKVTVVAPLNGTNALWTVLFSALVIRRLELVGPRLVLAAVLVVAGGALVAATR